MAILKIYTPEESVYNMEHKLLYSKLTIVSIKIKVLSLRNLLKISLATLPKELKLFIFQSLMRYLSYMRFKDMTGHLNLLKL
jgi:hypothetical protein